MANPIPCAICDTGADSSWLLTARDELTGLDPGTTVGVCAPCAPAFFAGLGGAMLEGIAENDAGNGASGPPAAGDSLAGSPGDDTSGGGDPSGDGGVESTAGPKSNGADDAPVAEPSKGRKVTTPPATDD